MLVQELLDERDRLSAIALIVARPGRRQFGMTLKRPQKPWTCAESHPLRGSRMERFYKPWDTSPSLFGDLAVLSFSGGASASTAVLTYIGIARSGPRHRGKSHRQLGRRICGRQGPA